VVAAIVVDRLARQRGTLCLFDDTAIYWQLADNLRNHKGYQVEQFGIPHWSLRMPGYPCFLLGVRSFFGDSTLPIRIVQAFINAASIPILMKLVCGLMFGTRLRHKPHLHLAVRWTGLISAIEPWSVGMSVLLLSESIFVPFMTVNLLFLAVLA